MKWDDCCSLNLEGINGAQTKTLYNYDMDNVKACMGGENPE